MNHSRILFFLLLFLPIFACAEFKEYHYKKFQQEIAAHWNASNDLIDKHNVCNPTQLEPRIHFVEQAISECQQAIHCLQHVLKETTGKEKWKSSAQEDARKVLNRCNQQMQELQTALTQLKWTALEQTKSKIYQELLSQSHQFKRQAVIQEGIQRTIGLQEALRSLQEAIKTLEELVHAISKIEKRNVNSVLNTYETQLLEQISIHQQTVEILKKQVIEYEELPKALKEKILLLIKDRPLFFGEEMSFKGYKMDLQMQAIFKELIHYEEAIDENEIAILQRRIQAFETQSDVKCLLVNPPELSQEEYWKREEVRRTLFYKQMPMDWQKTNLWQDFSQSIVIPLDGQRPNEQRYGLYENQFYQFLINHPGAALSIQVHQDQKIIHEETLILPCKDTAHWELFLTEDGMVFIPKTKLQTEFGLNLRISHFLDSLLISVSNDTSLYQFSIFTEEKKSLYQFYFITPPPAPLDVLRKPALPTTNKPFEKVFGQTNPKLITPIDILLAPKANSLLISGVEAVLPLDENTPIILSDGDILSFSSQPIAVELTPHPLLNAFVEEMQKDPLALAQYVYNEIEFTDPFLTKENEIFQAPAIHRSALGTFLGGQGSPWEQCALLVYFLRQAGYQAVYIEPEPYAVSKIYAEKLLFVQVPTQGEIQLQYPGVLFFDGEHWISLYPWMKEIQVLEGHELYSLMPEEYASADRWIKRYLCNDENIFKHMGPDGDDTAGILFVRFVEEELRKQGLSLQDVGAHRSVRKKQFVSWDDFPRPNFQGTLRPLEFLGNRKELFAYIDIKISSSEDPKKILCIPWVELATLDCRCFSIDFSPLGNSNHYLNLNISEGPSKPFRMVLGPTDNLLDIRISYAYKGWNGFAQPMGNERIFSLYKGTAAAICLQPGKISPQITSFYHKKYSFQNDEESRLHALLGFIGARYFERCGHSAELLAALHKLASPVKVGFGLIKLSPDRSSSTLTAQPELNFPQVDMGWFSHSQKQHPFSWHREINSAERQFSALFTVDYSSNEHQVLHEIFQDPYAISTVKLLQIAHREHQKQKLPGTGFLSLTSQSYAAAEKSTILAQCLYFPEFKKLNLLHLKIDAENIWETIGKNLGFQNGISNPALQNSDYAYAYLTPGFVYSQDGEGLHAPFYKGIGALILHPEGSAALISDNHLISNGGYGSRLPHDFVKNLDQWQPPSLQQTYHGIPSSKPICTSFYQKAASIPSFSLEKKACYQADVRPAHGSYFNYVADPVDIVTGAFYVDDLDLLLPGSFPLEVRRNYNSQNPIPGPLGYGWKLSLNPFLMEEEDKLYASQEDGTILVYSYSEDKDKWEVLPENNPNLTNFNQKGIGSTANPFHCFIEKQEDYILHGSDGSKRTFKNYLLQTWTDHTGNTLVFSYDQNRLSRVESANGHFFTLHYNHEGLIHSIHAKDGRLIRYRYDSKNNLTQVLLPNNATVTYEYDSDHQILRETKPHGKILENKYQEKKVVQQSSPMGPGQQMATSATFEYQKDHSIVRDAKEFATEYFLFQNQIYKIVDPEKNEILQSWFIDQTSWFDAETESVQPWNEPGSCPRSLKSSKDKRGLTTAYTYDQRGNPEKITLLGEDLTGDGERMVSKYFSYNENNLCEQVKTLHKTTRTVYDPIFPYLPKRIENYADQTLISYVSFEYGAKGLLKQEDNCGSITIWDYDNRGFLHLKTQKTKTEDFDVIEKYRFNNQGQCVEKRAADGIWQNDFDITGNAYATSVYRPSGQILYKTFTGYDLNNEIIWKEGPDPKNTLFFDRNASGLIKSTRQSLSEINEQLDGLRPSGIAYSLYEYDSRGHLFQETDALGFTTQRTFDALGRIETETKENLTTFFSYEAGGLLAKITSPQGAVTKRFYTTNGLLKKELFPDGTEQSFVYDFFGRPILETRQGISWKTTYDDAAKTVTRTHVKTNIAEVRELDCQGNLIRFTDGEGFIWKKSYDALQRLKTETSPEGYQTTWNYLGDKIVCYSPNGERTIQQFEAGQLIDTQSFNTENECFFQVSFKNLFALSMKKETTGDHTTTTWMNSFGQPVLTVAGNVHTIKKYNALGQCITSIDGEGFVTSQTLDVIGRLKTKTLPDGALLTYDYDLDSHLTACHLPGNLSWIASYDLMGRKITEKLQAADNKFSEQWHYNYVNGYLTETKNPSGVVKKIRYDEFGRIQKQSIAGQEKSYFYDKRGFLKTVEQTGDQPSLIERSYDPSGRLYLEKTYLGQDLIQESTQIWEPSKRILNIGDHERTFVLQGEQLTQLISGELELNYKYATNGSLIERSSPFHKMTLQYNDSGLPQEIDTQFFKESRQEILAWDRTGKLSCLESSQPQNSFSNKFTYTPRGHLQTTNKDTYAFDFGMPGRGILTNTNQSQIIEDGLDSFGKILREVIDHKILTTTYNANGQVASRISNDEQLFTWDVWGQLIGVTSQVFTWEAFYDPLGRRLQTNYTTQQGKTVVTSLYDPEEEFQEIGIQKNGHTFWKFYGPFGCDAIMDEPGASAVLVRDLLGNLVALGSLDSPLWVETPPSPYGDLDSLSLTGSDLFQFAQSLNWQSKQVDPTGLIWMGARYYDPQTGRFLSPDPVGYPACLDLYVYANGDPINFIDPDGRYANAAYNTIRSTVVGVMSYATHSTYDCLASYGKELDQLYRFVNPTSSAADSSLPFGNPGYNWTPEKIWQGHQKIDDFFGTNLRFGIGNSSMITQGIIPFGPGGNLLSIENHLFNIKTSIDRQKFLNEILKGISPKTVNITTDYRKNLIRYTGFDPGKSAEAHHVFPQQHRNQFLIEGIRIDDPRYLTWLEKNIHQKIHKKDQYNLQWRSFLSSNPSKIEILDKGIDLSKKYDFHINY
jgi:RHS repeat-associated protein